MQRFQLLRAANVRPGSVELHVLLVLALESEAGELESAVSAIIKNSGATEKDISVLMRIAGKTGLPEDSAIRLLVSVGVCAVGALARALSAADDRLVALAARALGELGGAAAPALEALRQVQAQCRRSGLSRLLGQTPVYEVISNAIVRIESGAEPGPLAQREQSRAIRRSRRLPKVASAMPPRECTLAAAPSAQAPVSGTQSSGDFCPQRRP